MDTFRVASVALIAIGAFLVISSWAQAGTYVLERASQNLIIGLALAVVGGLLYMQAEQEKTSKSRGKKSKK